MNISSVLLPVSTFSFVLQYFQELGGTLEHKKAALLSTLDELHSSISKKYNPLMEEVENLKLGVS